MFLQGTAYDTEYQLEEYIVLMAIGSRENPFTVPVVVALI